jgi:hypothetical protein
MGGALGQIGKKRNVYRLLVGTPETSRKTNTKAGVKY